MGFFSRSGRGRGRGVLSATSADLVRLGTASFGGEDPTCPGLSALSISELDGYVIAAMAAAGNPIPGTSEWAALHQRFFDELTATAERAGDWGFVGALCIANNFVADTDRQDSRFLAILDRALQVMRDDGVAFAAIPPYALRRWEDVHGTEGLSPAGWPSALAHLAVPARGEVPVTSDLAEDESRRMAQLHEGPHSNVIYAERRPGGTVVAVINGIDAADQKRKRWEWDGLDADDYSTFLCKLGDRLVTPSYWAHDDLVPYFPCRARSRNEMRIEASQMTQAGRKD
jgi:hypothetical protein